MRRLALLLLCASSASASPPTDTTHVPLRTKLRYGVLKTRASIVDHGAKLVGVAELAGLRYPVTPYQHQVSKALWRGSRLDEDQIVDLKARGFSAVVSLTRESNTDELPANANGLAYERIPILDNGTPTIEQVKSFLDFIAAHSEKGPVYVHCEAGIGRTGVMVAAYRMAFEGVSAADALRFPTEGDKPSRDPKQWGLKLPSQRRFVRALYRALQAGEIEGYPRSVGDAPTSAPAPGAADRGGDHATQRRPRRRAP